MTSLVRVRKTFKYKLKPTPEQERALAEVLWRCRVLYNTALEQRRTWWQWARHARHLLSTEGRIARFQSRLS